MNTEPILTAGVFGLGATELIIIFAVLLLLFGGAKLPSLAKGLGQSIREFKKASDDNNKDDDAGDEQDEQKKSVKKKESKPSTEARINGDN
jgi:sec-independent protein translocase protein TatA